MVHAVTPSPWEAGGSLSSEVSLVYRSSSRAAMVTGENQGFRGLQPLPPIHNNCGVLNPHLFLAMLSPLEALGPFRRLDNWKTALPLCSLQWSHLGLHYVRSSLQLASPHLVRKCVMLSKKALLLHSLYLCRGEKGKTERLDPTSSMFRFRLLSTVYSLRLVSWVPEVGQTVC